MQTTFDLPDCIAPSWGPSDDAIPSFSGLPFTPFSKRESVQYIADWQPSKRYRGKQRSTRQKFGDEEATLGKFSDGEDKFEGGTVVQRQVYDKTVRYRRDRTQLLAKLEHSQDKLRVRDQQKLRQAPKTQTRKKRLQQKRRRRKRYVENPRPADFSILKREHWADIKDVWFRDTFEQNNAVFYDIDDTKGSDPLNRLGIPYGSANKILAMCGTLRCVLDRFDEIACLNPFPLDYSNFNDYKFLSFVHKSATQDSNLVSFAKNEINCDRNPNHNYIYTTQNVLTTIMCCNRSKYSFDIVINKIGNRIFLDERSKVLSSWSVDETSQYRPPIAGTSRNFNYYKSLADEATYINHVFSEQMVSHKPDNRFQKKFKLPHPFKHEINGNSSGKGNKGGKNKVNQNQNSNMRAKGARQAASQAFIYKRFEVSRDLTVVCRCHVDGFDAKEGNKSWVNLKALNQYDSIKSKTSSWNKHLDNKQATILQTELKNNNFKCARWAIAAHLSGAKYFKLGYVMRSNPHSTEKHMICGVRKFRTNEWIRQISLDLRDSWTILGKFLKSVLDMEKNENNDCARFIALRDPLKQVMRVYRVSPDAFTKEDGLPSLGWIKAQLGYKTNEKK